MVSVTLLLSHRRLLNAQVLKLANGARSNATTTGQAGSEYNRYIAQVLTSFSIEAWVAPDHGGVVAVKPDLFELRIGGVGEPAPASFQYMFAMIRLVKRHSLLNRQYLLYQVVHALDGTVLFTHETGRRLWNQAHR